MILAAASNRPRLSAWFSCGDASATNTKLALAEYQDTHDIRIYRCVVPEEHDDNNRFAGDCEKWFDHEIINLRSSEYESCEDVWTRERYMSGTAGARCTVEMKKALRWQVEREWSPDLQAFGYTSDELGRVSRFREQNPDINMVSLLVNHGLDKEACHAIVRRAGLVCSIMYRLGFPNANCIGCVQAQSPRYWNRVRRLFPAVFAARAKLSRALGVRLVKLTSGDRDRIFLDELDPALDDGDEGPASECSLLCYIAEQTIAAPSGGA